MNAYYILRLVREDNPLDHREVQIKFFPVVSPAGTPALVLAETAESAFSAAKKDFPFHHIAIQEVKSYDRTVGALVAKRLLRGNAGPRSGDKAKGPIALGQPSGDSRMDDSRAEGFDADEKKAELAF